MSANYSRKLGQQDLGENGGVGNALLLLRDNFPERVLADGIHAELFLDPGKCAHEVLLRQGGAGSCRFALDANLAAKKGKLSPRLVHSGYGSENRGGQISPDRPSELPTVRRKVAKCISRSWMRAQKNAARRELRF
ncbi:MAG TPA: hypothetical protein VFT72_10815 [Opitutaceae bacterium]|nr:hypothetical protein [Opitutaceae bacterium]